MRESASLECDGCGQAVAGEHMARRLRRLEWATRYRPVHIHNLFLGAFSPREDQDFLYAPGGEFRGEAGHLLRAVGVATPDKTWDEVLAEFQRSGFFLTHLLECPLEDDVRRDAERAKLMSERLSVVASRIRRSLKPKRVFLVSPALDPVVGNLVALDLGCPVVLNGAQPFALEALTSDEQFLEFRGRLAGAANG